MFSWLQPRSTLTENEINRSLRLMVWGGMAENAMFALASGGFLASFALALGANNLQIGILAALPYVTQVIQFPAILAVEKFRRRKALGIPAAYVTNLLWIPAGIVPFFMDTPGSGAIIAFMAVIGFRGIFASTWNTAWVSWMSDLVPKSAVGSYYGRRWAYVIAAIALVSLAASFFVDWWTTASPVGQPIYAYSFLLIGGAIILGIPGPTFAALCREPLMPPALDTGRSVISTLAEPLRDRNFAHLVRFLFVWNFASNLAIPFFAVYMLSILGYSLPAVIGFTVLSQFSNILFMRVWGPFADRVGSKTVLSMSASLYLLVIAFWPFTTLPEPHQFTLPLIAAIHVFAGIAFVLGLFSLNLLIALQEQGEVPRGMALAELSIGITPITRMVSSVPGLNSLSAFSVGFLKRVPGGDVALGVTAYQLAASTRAAVSSTSRGVALATHVGRQVHQAMQDAIEEVQDVGELGMELARHATRGAMEAGDELVGHVGQLTQGAVLGSVQMLAGSPADDLEALAGAGYGVVQGASQTGQDLEEVGGNALQAARDLSGELGLTELEAATALAAGALQAARAEGSETLAAVQQALPDDLTLSDPASEPGGSTNQDT